MSLSVHTLELTPAERRQALRVNRALAVAPRLRTDGWRVAIGQRLNGAFSLAAGSVSAVTLKRRGVRVSTFTIPGPTGPLSIRALIGSGTPRALIVDLHGGGWVVGSAALNDGLTVHLAEAGFVTLSVDYRLLDEVRGVWMADAVADCAAALRWALTAKQRWNVCQVFVVGESAGAHLAALAVLKLRDEGVHPSVDGCVFVQGVFDLGGTPSACAAGADALLFDGPNLQRDLGKLTPDRDEAARRQPDVSPLYADLTGMPPALFIMGEADPFRDDSLLMAEAWGGQAPATLLEVPTAPHGFQHFCPPTARLAQDYMRGWLNQAIG